MARNCAELVSPELIEHYVVKENCSEGYSGANPQDDVMERLLRTKMKH